MQYTYEIVKVDEASRCMEIVYSADGHQTMHVSARLPFVGETLETIVDMHSPVPLWIELAKSVQVPTVGVQGSISSASAPEDVAVAQQVMTIPVNEVQV